MIDIKINNENYKCEELTQEVQNAFKKYIENEELKVISKARNLDDTLYRDMMRDYLFRVNYDAYALDSDLTAPYLQLDEHLAELFWYCLSKHRPMDKSDVLKMMKEDPNAFRELWLVLNN